MSLTESHPPRRRIFPIVVHAGWMLAMAAPPAAGHALLISRGEVVIDSETAVLDLEVNAEDFLHFENLRPNAGGRVTRVALERAAMRHSEVLRDALIVRDQDVNRLHCAGFQFTDSWFAEGDLAWHELRGLRARYKAHFKGVDASRLITFQLLPGRAVTQSAWQIVLSVRGQGQPHGTGIRLTSRGNAETLEIDWSWGEARVKTDDASGEWLGLCGRPGGGLTTKLKQIVAEFQTNSEGIDATISIPLPLIETWITVPRREVDFVDTERQAALLASIRPLIEEAVTISAGKSVLRGDIQRVALLTPLETLDQFHGRERSISFWTGRVAAQVRYVLANGENRDATLRWNLFNGAVLSVTAALREGDRCENAEFSTYQPEIHWRLGCGAAEP